MQAGNARYLSEKDFPETIPVFPLSGALLLPGGQIPLNIFEPRYLQMIEDAICSDRLVGMVQPRFDAGTGEADQPQLCDVGCVGRLTAFTGFGRLSRRVSAGEVERLVTEASRSEPGELFYLSCCFIGLATLEQFVDLGAEAGTGCQIGALPPGESSHYLRGPHAVNTQ